MKLRNRVLSIIMVLAMLVSSVAVFAEDAVENTTTAIPASTEKLYGKLLLLESLGFFEDMNALVLDEQVTRATYAGWLEKVANLIGEKPYQTVEFSDVAADNEQYAAIQNVVAAGYMSGMGGSVFMPSAAISLSDAAVSLVRLTGKEAYARLRGGYPTGYEVTARSLGLYDGVKSGVNTTVNVLTMIYNALNADYLTSEGISNKGVVYVTGETVLSFFHNIYPVEGTMTANGFTKTYSDAIISNSNSVEIDKLVYECDNSKLHDLIGKYVQGFYRHNKETNERTLVSAYADADDNTIIELSSRELSTGGHNLRLLGLTLYYPVDNGAREKKIELAPGFDFIYNNRAVPTRLDADILVPDGELTFIDKDNDRKYDTVIAKARVTEKITGIDNYNTEIYTNTLEVKKSDYEGAVIIIKKQDKKTGVVSEVTLDELKIGSVVTIYRSKDGMYNEVITCEQSEYLTPTGIGEDDVVYADDTSYEFANVSEKSKIIVGFACEFYFDYLGRIAYIELSANQDYTYGYVFEVKEDFEQEAWFIKMLTPFGERKYKVHTKVMVDGVSGCLPESLVTYVPLYEIIRYRLGKDETIRSVDTVNNVIHACPSCDKTHAHYDERHNKLIKNIEFGTVRYNQAGRSFGAYGEYVKGRSTFTITAPTDSEEKLDIKNYKAYLVDGDTGDRSLSIYDWNEDTLEIGVVIEHASGSVNKPPLTKKSPVAVAKKLYRVWEDGEDVLKLDLVQKGANLSYVIADTVVEFEANQIGFGDVVAYELNAEGEIASLDIDIDVDETTPRRAIMEPFDRSSKDYKHVYGKILKRYSTYMTVEPIAGDAASYSRVSIPVDTIQDLTLVDMTEKAISAVSADYFSTNVGGGQSPSYLYAMTYKNARTDELVIYKY